MEIGYRVNPHSNVDSRGSSSSSVLEVAEVSTQPRRCRAGGPAVTTFKPSTDVGRAFARLTRDISAVLNPDTREHLFQAWLTTRCWRSRRGSLCCRSKSPDGTTVVWTVCCRGGGFAGGVLEANGTRWSIDTFPSEQDALRAMWAYLNHP